MMDKNGVFGSISRLLCPPKCMLCRRIIDDGYICGDCQKSLSLCGEIKNGGEFFSKCAAAVYYNGNVRRALLAMKFRGKRAYAEGFSRLTADVIRDVFTGEYDIITWVPISAKRLRKRGYDQAKLIAEKTAEKLGTNAVKSLIKIRHTKANSSLKGKAERRANVSGAYVVENSESIRDKRILIIDDIITTGATLAECARMLLMAGAEDVVCCTAAYAGGAKAKNTR